MNFFRGFNLSEMPSKATMQFTYRKMALERHPDKTGGDRAAMTQLNRAKSLLEGGKEQTKNTWVWARMNTLQAKKKEPGMKTQKERKVTENQRQHLPNQPCLKG